MILGFLSDILSEMLEVSSKKIATASLILSSCFFSTSDNSALAKETIAIAQDENNTEFDQALKHTQESFKVLTEKSKIETIDLTEDLIKIKNYLDRELETEELRFKIIVHANAEMGELVTILMKQLKVAEHKNLELISHNISSLATLFQWSSSDYSLISSFVFKDFEIQNFLEGNLDDYQLTFARLESCIVIMNSFSSLQEHSNLWISSICKCQIELAEKHDIANQEISNFLNLLADTLTISSRARINSSTEEMLQHSKYCSLSTKIISKLSEPRKIVAETFKFLPLLIAAEPYLRIETSFINREAYHELSNNLITLLELGLNNFNQIPDAKSAELRQIINFMPSLKNTSINLQEKVLSSCGRYFFIEANATPDVLNTFINSASPLINLTNGDICTWSKYSVNRIIARQSVFFKLALENSQKLILKEKDAENQANLLRNYANAVQFFDQLSRFNWGDFQIGFFKIYEQRTEAFSEQAQRAINSIIFPEISKNAFILLAQPRIIAPNSKRYEYNFNSDYCNSLEAILIPCLMQDQTKLATLLEITKNQINEIQSSETGLNNRIELYRILRFAGALEQSKGNLEIYNFLLSRIAKESNPHALRELGSSIGFIWNLSSTSLLNKINDLDHLCRNGLSNQELMNMSDESLILFEQFPKFMMGSIKLTELQSSVKNPELVLQNSFLCALAGLAGDQDSLLKFAKQIQASNNLELLELRHRLSLVLAGSILSQSNQDYRSSVINLINSSFVDFGNQRQIGERLAALFHVLVNSPLQVDQGNQVFLDEQANYYRKLIFDGGEQITMVNGLDRRYRLKPVIEMLLDKNQTSLELLATRLEIADDFLRFTQVTTHKNERTEFLIKLGYSNADAIDPNQALKIIFPERTK